MASYYLFTRDAVQNSAYRSTPSSAVSTLPGEQRKQCPRMRPAPTRVESVAWSYRKCLDHSIEIDGARDTYHI